MSFPARAFLAYIFERFYVLFPAIMEIAPIFLTRVTMAEFSLLYLFDVVSLKSDSSMVGSGVRYLEDKCTRKDSLTLANHVTNIW